MIFQCRYVYQYQNLSATPSKWTWRGFSAKLWWRNFTSWTSCRSGLRRNGSPLICWQLWGIASELLSFKISSCGMLKCKLGQFSVTIFAFFQIQCYHFCARTPFQCYQFCSSVLPFLRLYTLYIIRKIYLYIFLLLYKIELKMNSKSYAYARVARTREGKRNFVYSQ